MIDNHCMDIEKMKMQHQKVETNLRQTLDDVQYKTLDLRPSKKLIHFSFTDIFL